MEVNQRPPVVIQEEQTPNPYAADPQFQQYYQQILASMTPQTIDYQAPTSEEIAAQISAYLRPAVDQQIRNRRQSTLQQRAATDADAASRGILGSTWVTDIKNRLHQSETADIAAAESDYRSQLLQGVFNRQAQEADRANQIAMFNAQMRQQAEDAAYNRAGDMYNIYLQKKKGSGGGSKPAETPAEAAGDDLTNDPGYAIWLAMKTQLDKTLNGFRPGALVGNPAKGQGAGLLSGIKPLKGRPLGSLVK